MHNPRLLSVYVKLALW